MGHEDSIEGDPVSDSSSSQRPETSPNARLQVPYVPPQSAAQRRRAMQLGGEGLTDVSRTRAAAVSSSHPENSDRLVAPWLVKLGRSSWYLIGIGVIAVAIAMFLLKLVYVVAAIFVAFLITALLNPLVRAMSKHIKRWLAVVIALVGSAAFFIGLLAFVVASVAEQWSSLTHQLIHGIDKILDFADSTPFDISVTSDDVIAWLQDMIQRAEKYATDNWQTLVGKVASNAGTIGIAFTVIVLSIFVSVFFLYSGAKMWRWFLNLLPTQWRANTNRAAEAGWRSFSGYARGTVLIALTDGAMAWIYLEILRIPLAPALGVLVGFGAFIPLVGAPAAMVVAMIVALAVDGVWKAVAVGIGIALIGQLEGHVLQPLIMGHQVSLSPLVIGIGVVAGTYLGGLFGAVVAVPIMGVTWAVFSSLYHRDPPIVGPLPGSLPPVPKPERKRFFRRLWPFGKHDTKPNASSSPDAPAAVS